ncbi:MAG: VCBS repeat-containing protein [Lewinellaceae bacterium]|nr:VCBS repeat-containing protein [Lewinellaceae bacterium]
MRFPLAAPPIFEQMFFQKHFTLLAVCLLGSTLLDAQNLNPFSAPEYLLNNQSYYIDNIEIADLDGDGRADVVGSDWSTGIRWFKTDTAGRVTDVHEIAPFTHGYFGLNLTDWDGDQDIDVVFGHHFEGFYYWQANDGAGNFSPKQSLLAIDSVWAGYFKLGDLNQDGLPDVVQVLDGNPDPSLDSLVITWHPNDGSGQLGSAISLDRGNFRPYEPTPVDLDGDGDQDLAWVENYQLVRMLNDGSGQFGPAQVAAADSNLVECRFHYLDFDGDGDSDVFPEFTNYTYQGFLYLPNDGVGNFGPAVRMISDTIPYFSYFAVADFTGDGLADVITEDGVRNTQVFINKGLGQLFEKNTLPASSNHLLYDLEVGDVDDDGDTDVLRIHSAGVVHWLENPGTGAFSNFGGIIPEVSPSALKAADLNGDGLDDYIFGENYTDLAAWLPNLGNGLFGPKKIIAFELFGVDDIIPIDLDMDGDLDSLTHEWDNRTKWFANDGAGNFGPATILWTQIHTFTAKIYALDFDNDGDNDILTPEKLLFNDGAGHFDSTLALYFQGYIPYDLDRDSFVDIFFGHTWAKFNGIDSFLFQQTNLESFGPWFHLSSQFIDMDSDSLPELFMGVQNNYWTLILRQNQIIGGTPVPLDTFDIYPASGIPAPVLKSVDMDGDGWLDLLISNYHGAGNWLLLFNNGQGEFSGSAFFTFDGLMEPADLDGDGIPDLQCADAQGTGWMRSFVRNFWASGTCFFDENGDGLRQPGELPIQNMGVGIVGGTAVSFTDTLGRFRLFASPSEAHEIQFLTNLCWALSSDSALLTLAPSMTGHANLEFGFEKMGDTTAVRPTFVASQTRCGMEVPFWATLQNVGCHAASGRLGIVSDTATVFQNASPLPDLISPGPGGRDTIWWAFDSLPASLSHTFQIVFLMPDANYVGDSIHLSSYLFLENSAQALALTESRFIVSEIRCAYDPNDKLVNRPTLPPEYLPQENELEYTIRFQNTGNDTASTVRIRDTLDYWLDMSSFQPLGASHPYRCELNWDFHGVEFVFENIALPDSNVNEPQSHGFVSFSIFPFPGLPEGGLLSNRVDIYFDQNPAVSTNRVETIVQFPVDLKPETQASRGILIFPNPTTGTINVKLPEPAKPGAKHPHHRPRWARGTGANHRAR